MGAGSELPPGKDETDSVVFIARRSCFAASKQQYRELDWARVRDEMARPLVLDARNMLSPLEMKALGFEYHSFGRPDLLNANQVFALS